MKIKLIIWFCLLFFLISFFGLWASSDQAYLAIIYPPWKIKVSFFWGCLFLALVFVFLHALIRIFSKFLNLPTYIANHIQFSREEKALKTLCQAIKFFAAGRFFDANKSVEKTIKYANLLGSHLEKKNFFGLRKKGFNKIPSDMVCAANLLGAVVSSSLLRYPQCQQRLNEIFSESWKEARFLLEAKLACQNNEFDIADTALRQYFFLGGSSYLANELAAKIAEHRNHWSVMREQAILYENGMKEKKDLAFSGLRLRASKNLLYANRGQPDEILRIWKNFDDKEKQILELVEPCIIFLLHKQRYVDVCDIAEFVLVKNFSENLIHCYCVAASNHDIPRAVAYIEKVQSKWTEKGSIFYVLGYLCYKQKIWGKAQTFFEQALLLSSSDDYLKARIHFALARMFEQLEEKEKAQKHVKLGSKIMERVLPQVIT